MLKSYRTPTIASLGAAEVVTRGLPRGPLAEVGPSFETLTTHHMIDL